MLRTLFFATMFALPTPSLGQANQSVSIEFQAQVNGAAFKCGQSYAGVGAPAATITPKDMRFFITGVALTDASGKSVPIVLDQGGAWQYRNVALLDFEDGSGPCRQGGNAGLNATVKGKIPPGTYVGLTFEVGLPFDLGHGDATVAPPPLNTTSMFWTWAAGYRFVKIDLSTAAMPGMAGHEMHQTGFALHIGSTGCESRSMTERPSSCAQPNIAKVSFARFDPAHDKIVFDLGAALAGTNVAANAPDTAPGCMGDQDDPDCKAIFQQFGLPFGAAAGKAQSVFSIAK